ncbi:MAG: tetratricopeptide repeat protein [SAR324 cluster bacterium]|nr:tetratricopeptide repeat protein [SAR324 cluster bacterium]
MFHKVYQLFQEKTVSGAVNLLKHKTNEQLAQQNFAAAEASLKKILEMNPDEEDSLVALSKVLLQQNKLQEGYLILQKTIAVNPQHSALILRFVDASQGSQQFEKIEELLHAAIQNEPDVLELRLCLGQILFEKGKVAEAETALEEIIKRDSLHLEAHIGLTHCYISKGNKSEALTQVNTIRQWDQKRADELMSAIYENVQNF